MSSSGKRALKAVRRGESLFYSVLPQRSQSEKYATYEEYYVRTKRWDKRPKPARG